MTENPVTFRYNSLRAAKARLGFRLSKVWRFILWLIVIILIFLGSFVVVVGRESFGWILIAFATPLIMILEWYAGELRHPGPVGTSLDGVMAGDILGQLSKNPTPEDLARVAMSVSGGRFFALRYGITLNILLNITSNQSMETSTILENSLRIRQESKSEYISGAVVVVAIVDSFADKNSLLAHMNLGIEDLYAGIAWYEHLRLLQESEKKPRRTGGIARDFSFGYTPQLKRFGDNLSEQSGLGLHVEVASHQKVVDRIVDIFSKGGHQNVALVGPEGSGKTTIVRSLAKRLLDAESKTPDNLKFRQVFLLDSAAIIAAAPERGQVEALVMQILDEAYRAKNVIICLDKAQLFFEEGTGSVDLSNVLLPVLENGSLRIILTLDEQRFLQIGQHNPSLVNSLNRISVSPTDKTETMLVAQGNSIINEYQRNVVYMFQAFDEAYRLSERYIYDLAMPGRALKLLDSAAGYAENGFVTGNSVHQAIEQTMNIKVGVARVDEERDRLLNLENLIHGRMINQTRAVQVVSDALRRARSGVRNENRPIGTFLFLGPTGVGKTELSKALAEVYFGGEENMIRLDLNQYVRPEDVTRLIADGADDPNSLTAQVMKKPFSVVLLDEIEKAHPQVLTTLLQLLDEGILRDINNREVSFRDAIIITTSNAGADRIREYIQRGYRLQDFEKQFIDELISSNQFRPEFLNRFDEIVVFRPLNKTELIQVVDLMLRAINKQMELQKVQVSVNEDAKALLVERGYDPRLGARPMRRMVQRAVENLVAKQVLTGSVEPGSTIQVTKEQVQAALDSDSI